MTWLDLSPYRHELADLAKQRDMQKQGYQSSNYWSGKPVTDESPHFIGLCGEMRYSLHTGLPVDKALNVLGDRGEDFIDGMDVKTSTFLTDPHLKVPTITRKWPRRGYVLAVLDQRTLQCRLAGWATVEVVRRAPVRQYGHVDDYFLTEAQMQPFSLPQPELKQCRKEGDLRPYLDACGNLVVPTVDCDPKYRWWAGGQSIAETFDELARIPGEH